MQLVKMGELTNTVMSKSPARTNSMGSVAATTINVCKNHGNLDREIQIAKTEYNVATPNKEVPRIAIEAFMKWSKGSFFWSLV